MGGKSAFILFCDDERQSLKKYHPKWSFGEITKELGSMWRKLKNDEKEAYMDRAHKLRNETSQNGNEMNKKKRKLEDDSGNDENVLKKKKTSTRKEKDREKIGSHVVDFVVDKLMKESIPIVLAGVPQNKIPLVHSHLKKFQSNVKETLSRFKVPINIAKNSNLARIASVNKEIENSLVSAYKSHTSMKKSVAISTNNLESEEIEYNDLMDRLQRLESKVISQKPHPLLQINNSDLTNG